jgi:hypothetical protein
MASVKINEKNRINTVWIDEGNRVSVINEVLPFRIRFTAIQIPGYSSTTVPPIPLQIIGYSNYIL